VNCSSGQQGRSLYSSLIYRLNLGFGRFFRGACNRFWNVLLQKDTEVWANEVLIITELQASRSKVEEPIPDTLRFRTTKESELDMNFF
jgi:hypothetical protein